MRRAAWGVRRRGRPAADLGGRPWAAWRGCGRLGGFRGADRWADPPDLRCSDALSDELVTQHAHQADKDLGIDIIGSLFIQI